MLLSSLVFTFIINMLLGNKLFKSWVKVFGFSLFFIVIVSLLFSVLRLWINPYFWFIYGLFLFFLFISVLPRILYIFLYLIDNDYSIRDAFKDGWASTKKAYWVTLLFLVLFFVIFSIIVGIFSSLFSLIPLYNTNVYFASFLETIVGTLVSFWFYGFLVSVYLELTK